MFAIDINPCLMVIFNMTKINLMQLVKEIEELERHQVLYAVLKRELGKLGYWKNRQRGDPAKGYKARRS